MSIAQRRQLASLGFCVDIGFEREMEPVVEQVANFLHPFFANRVDMQADLHVRLRPSSEFPESLKNRCIRTVVVRKSSSPRFNLELLGGDIDGDIVLWEGVGEFGYIVNRAETLVELFFRHSPFFHLIELIRYFGLLVEESHGRLVLHGSAVVDRLGNAVGIVGSKGAGKTTTMLRMVMNEGCQFLSGDKLLVWQCDGKLWARGWPDFPHVGLRSIQSCPSFYDAIKSDLAHCEKTPGTDKLLIDPFLFRLHIPVASNLAYPLDRLLLPNIAGDTPFSSVGVRTEDKKMCNKNSIVEETSRFSAATWHGIAPKNSCENPTIVRDGVWHALQRIPWYSQGPGMAG